MKFYRRAQYTGWKLVGLVLAILVLVVLLLLALNGGGFMSEQASMIPGMSRFG